MIRVEDHAAHCRVAREIIIIIWSPVIEPVALYYGVG